MQRSEKIFYGVWHICAFVAVINSSIAAAILLGAYLLAWELTEEKK